MGERTEEVNFAELLRVARSEFNPADQTLVEARLAADWPKLRAALGAAQLAWDAGLSAARLPAPAVTRPRPVPAQVLAPHWAASGLIAVPISRISPSTPQPAGEPWLNRLRARAANLARLTAAQTMTLA